MPAEFWARPGGEGSPMLQRLLARARAGQLPDVAYGEVRQTLDPSFPSVVGVRDFARRAGVEHLLEYDPDTQRVTLGGYEVPYAFGYQGRTYADRHLLEAILRRLQEEPHYRQPAQEEPGSIWFRKNPWRR